MQPRPWQQAIAQKNRKELLRLIQETDREVAKVVRASALRVERIIARLPGEGIGVVVRRALYRQQRAALIKVINDLWGGKVQKEVIRGVKASTKLVLQAQEQINAVLLKAAPKGAEALADSMLRAAASRVETLRARLLNSIDLSQNVYRNAALTTGRVDAIVNEGITLGKSAAEIAKEAAQYINPATEGGVRYSAMRLGRTELNNAFHTVSVQAFGEQPWVRGVLWNLSGSHPEGDECDELAEVDDFGLGPGVFPPDLVPFKPHPQCYCYLTTITPEPSEFIDRLIGGEYDVAA